MKDSKQRIQTQQDSLLSRYDQDIAACEQEKNRNSGTAVSAGITYVFETYKRSQVGKKGFSRKLCCMIITFPLMSTNFPVENSPLHHLQ